METTEIEFKTLLSKENYQKLIHFFALEDTLPFTQKNTYFDTAKATLKKQHYALRIRELETSSEMTLKVPQTTGLLEITEALTLKERQDFQISATIPKKATIEKALAKIDVSFFDLNSLGSLTTKRFEIPVSFGLFALDESAYFNQVDYELELEVTDFTKGQQDFFQFLKEQHLPYEKALPKIVRMLQAAL